MGFETRLCWKITQSGDYNKAVPMGFETQDELCVYFCEIDNKAVPMGFETCTLHKRRFTECQIIKQSLWDLKLMTVPKEVRTSFNNKAVPMGFETCDISIFFGGSAQ